MWRSLIQCFLKSVEEHEIRKGFDPWFNKKIRKLVRSNDYNPTDNSFDIDLSGAVVEQKLCGLGFHDKKRVKMSMKYDLKHVLKFVLVLG